MADLSVTKNRLVVEDSVPPPKVHWLWASGLTLVHIGGAACLILLYGDDWKWKTVVLNLALGYAGGFGVTVGAHRYFAHRTFKAVQPLRIFFALCHTLAFQHSVLQWVKWHRAHHKNSDTEMDPHNASRGFFYSHMGWLAFMNWERSDVQTKSVDVSDLEADPFIVWQHRYFYPLTISLSIVIPILVPWYLFDESFAFAFCVVCFRLMLSFNFTFLVNSAAHLYGYRPYGKDIYPRENPLVGFLALGEGWHNYHHIFPWDFRASEFGPFYRFNPSAAIIMFFAALGWAYDLKTASPKLIKERIQRTGDGSSLSVREDIIANENVHEDDFDDGISTTGVAEILYPQKRHI